MKMFSFNVQLFSLEKLNYGEFSWFETLLSETPIQLNKNF